MLVTSSKFLRALAQTGATTNSNSTTSTAILPNALHHGVAVFASATSVLIYFDGNASAVGTNSIAFSGVNLFSVGALYLNTATAIDLWKGTIAYPVVRNIALSGSNVTDLYNGGAGRDSSQYLPGSIVSFSKFQSGPPYLDTGANTTWTLTGSPTIVADPFSIGAVSLSGTCTAHAANSLGLLVEQILVSSVTVRAANSAKLFAPKALIGVDTVQFVISALLSSVGNPKPLFVEGLAKAANAGDMFVERYLAAEVVGNAANSGSYAVYQELEGAAIASGSSLSDLYMEVVMTASCVIQPAETGVYLSQTALYSNLLAVAANSADLTNLLFILGRNAIELQLFTQQFMNLWVPQNPNVLVKYSNRNFTAPSSATYVEFGVDSGSVEDIALGGLVQRGMGEVHLDIYAAENSGTMTMRILADAFADCFDRVNFQYNNGVIWTRRAEILRASPIQGWSRWRVVVPFKHDQFDVPVLELA